MFLRRLSVILIILGLSITAAYSQNKVEFKSKADSVSYSIGFNVGQNLLNQFQSDTIPNNPALVIEGVKDGVLKQTAKLSQEQMMGIMMALQQDIMAKREVQKAEMEKQRKVSGEANKKKGEDFLAENKKKAGIQTTASGLQYKVTAMGTGPKPTTANEVKVHYKGMLIDGKVFDSSYDRKEPVTFPVTGVIKGWTEVLQLMPEGSKWTAYIPSEIAYGERGAGKDIGPNEVLVFDIELLQVIDKGNEVKTPAMEPKKK